MVRWIHNFLKSDVAITLQERDGETFWPGGFPGGLSLFACAPTSYPIDRIAVAQLGAFCTRSGRSRLAGEACVTVGIGRSRVSRR